MNRDDIRTLLTAGFLALAIVVGAAAFAYADEPKLPAGITCEDVREKVSELGWAKALALAVEKGATWRQIREARKCLH